MAGAMPWPVSLTMISTWEFTRWRWTCTRPLLGVNLTAFMRRFHSTCWSRAGSPITGPARGSSTLCTRIPLGLGGGPDGVQRAVDHGGEINRAHVQPHLPADDA
jgi:hypothetical protein